MAPRVVRGKPQATQAKNEEKKENDEEKKVYLFFIRKLKISLE